MFVRCFIEMSLSPADHSKDESVSGTRVVGKQRHEKPAGVLPCESVLAIVAVLDNGSRYSSTNFETDLSASRTL